MMYTPAFKYVNSVVGYAAGTQYVDGRMNPFICHGSNVFSPMNWQYNVCNGQLL